MPQDSEILHASCVALEGRGLLILGPSGAGKSGLALQLMALGARLVADDRTEVFRDGSGLSARCPPALAGLIEARGIGILRADPLTHAPVVLAVDLGQSETERLPQRRVIFVLGATIDLVLGPQSAHFASALCCYLRGQRYE
jgi:HPr kinase/phosphorylase